MIHFIVHEADDTVGVMTVDVKKGQSLTGWNMTSDKTIRTKAAQDIPLGHKIALVDIPKGQPVIKYGESIGVATKPIKKGQHVHTHNLKTARW
ncbi:MAG: UxaA family hydrolase [Planctomycetes bacterium]|nr:UxaA family hydrolase [Planctomycetota bacterium]